MGRILIKPGVDFGTTMAPAGARILEVVKQIAPLVDFDIVITSARDGKHSGPSDPHYSGEAFDFRTQTLTQAEKLALLTHLKNALYREPQRNFYAFLEDAGGGNEHIHVQRRNGTTYTITDYLTNQ